MDSFKPFSAAIDNRGRVYISVLVRRLDKNRSAKVKFMYDSGADFTTISFDDLTKLGYSLKEIECNAESRGTVETAGGDKYETFTMDFGVSGIMKQVFPAKFKMPLVCSIKRIVEIPEQCNMECELAENIYRGMPSSLLGNDILSAFDIASDRKSGVMKFTRLGNLSERNKKYGHFELKNVQTNKDVRQN